LLNIKSFLFIKYREATIAKYRFRSSWKKVTLLQHFSGNPFISIQLISLFKEFIACLRREV